MIFIFSVCFALCLRKVAHHILTESRLSHLLHALTSHHERHSSTLRAHHLCTSHRRSHLTIHYRVKACSVHAATHVSHRHLLHILRHANHTLMIPKSLLTSPHHHATDRQTVMHMMMYRCHFLALMSTSSSRHTGHHTSLLHRHHLLPTLIKSSSSMMMRCVHSLTFLKTFRCLSLGRTFESFLLFLFFLKQKLGPLVNSMLHGNP